MVLTPFLMILPDLLALFGCNPPPEGRETVLPSGRVTMTAAVSPMDKSVLILPAPTHKVMVFTPDAPIVCCSTNGVWARSAEAAPRKLQRLVPVQQH